MRLMYGRLPSLDYGGGETIKQLGLRFVRAAGHKQDPRTTPCYSTVADRKQPISSNKLSLNRLRFMVWTRTA